MKTSTTVTSLATAGLVGLGALGIYGVTEQKNTQDELSAATEIARIVENTRFHADSGEDANSEVLALTEEQLDQLPASARTLAGVNKNEKTAIGSDTNTADALKASAEDLYRLVVDHPDAKERGQALEFSHQYWDLYTDITGSDQEVPDWVTASTPAECASSESKDQASESVQALMGSAYAYLYAAQLFDARADVDGWEAEMTGSALDEAESTAQELTEATGCSWQVPTRASSYAIKDTKDPEGSLQDLRTEVNHNVEAALADPAIAADSELFISLAEIFYAQKIS